MGAEQSKVFVEALQRKPTPVVNVNPPPDPTDQREKKRVELTMARNDLVGKQQAYDIVAPDEASQRKIKEAPAANNKYIADMKKQFNYETRLLNQSIEQADALSNSGTYILAQKYTKSLEKQYIHVEQDNKINKEKIFTNRRRFLDADPQSGVPGIGNYQTVDEQVLLAFWLSYVLFCSVVIFYVLEMNRARFSGVFTLTTAGIASLAGLILCAHLVIRNFCT